MKKILVIIICIICYISFFSCTKYKQATKKIFGLHTLVKYTVDGIDSLSLYKDSLATDFEFQYLEDDGINCVTVKGVSAIGKYIYFTGRWLLLDSEHSLEFLFGGLYIGTGPFGKDKKSTWDIITLKKDIWQMRANYNGKEYFIELDKK